MYNEKFWLAITFFTFIALILKLAMPKIRTDLDNQAQKISDDIENAKKLLDDAKNSMEKSKITLEKAEKYAKDIIDEANNDAKKIVDDAIANANKDFADKINKVIANIEHDKELAINNFKKEIILLSLKSLENEYNDQNLQSAYLANKINSLK